MLTQIAYLNLFDTQLIDHLNSFTINKKTLLLHSEEVLNYYC